MLRIYDFLSTRGGQRPAELKKRLSRRAATLQGTARREIPRVPREPQPSLVRIYSDFTGEGGGGAASPELFAPLLLRSNADEASGRLASSTNKVSSFELFAPIAPIPDDERRLEGGKLFAFIDNEAACAVSTEGAPKERASSKLVFFAWASIAKLNLSLWVGRVPAGANLADAPPRRKRMGFPAIMEGDMPKLRQESSFRDISVRSPRQAGGAKAKIF